MIMAMIAVGALVGAPARYLIDRAIQRRHETTFPWGTLTVNLLACALLGAVAGAGSTWDPSLSALLGTGLAGTLSTYSTFGYETMRLDATGDRFHAVANVAVSVAAGIGAAAVGCAVGTALA